jgi:hypothetical protein
MPQTDIPQQQIVLTGIGAQYVAADGANGMVVRNAIGTTIHVRNRGAVNCSISITPPVPADGLSLRTLTVPILAGTDRFFGRIVAKLVDSSGSLNITFAGTDLSLVDIAALTYGPVLP